MKIDKIKSDLLKLILAGHIFILSTQGLAQKIIGNDEEYVWMNARKGTYYTAYKIPGTDYYSLAEHSLREISRDKAKSCALGLGLHKFNDEDYKKIDKNKDRIISFEEEKDLMKKKYGNNFEIKKEGIYRLGKLVED